MNSFRQDLRYAFRMIATIGGGDTGTPVADGREMVPEAHIRNVSEGYFATTRFPLRAGRPVASLLLALQAAGLDPSRALRTE